MKVGSVMTRDAQACRESSSLTDVAKIMWDRDCGIVPVIDGARTVRGLITDRDICMAAATRNLTTSEIQAGDVMGGEVHGCHASDEVRDALAKMKEHQVRRLVVTDERNRLEGIVSLNDLVLAAKKGGGTNGVAEHDVADTLKGICEHRAAVPA